MRRLAGVLLALALLGAGAGPASADCPGAAPSCPYTSSFAIGQRAEGVLRFPQAVAVAPDGSVIVGDQGSHVVQIFNPDGSFRGELGVAGTRPGQLTAVGAVAAAPDGSILVADGSNRIERFTPGGSLLNWWGSSGTAVGQFHFGAGGGNSAAAGGGLAVWGDTLYVADTANNRVQRFTIDGGHGAEIVAPGQLANPRGIAVRKTRMLVADDQHHRLAVFDTGGHPLASVGSGPGPSPGQLNFPYGVAIDPAGRVFVADDMNQRVVRYGTAPRYPYKARWGSYGTGPGQLAYPRNIATDRQGDVYVANTGNDRVDVFDASGTLLRSMGTSGRAPGQFNAPLGVAVDASGIRAVTDSVNGRVELLRPDGSLITVWGSPAPGPTILPSPVAAAFDPSGNLLVLDQRRGRIVEFARASGLPVATFASRGSGPGRLLDPSALAISPDGTILVADTGNDRLARFDGQGDYLGSITGLDGPRGVAVSPDGARIYVSNRRNRITVYDADGNQLDQFGGTGSKLGKLNAPAQLTVDAAGNLWVADRGNNRVQEFGPDGERLAMFGRRGIGPGQFVHPTSVAVDCTGALTVTDSANNRLQQFALAGPSVTPCAALPPVGTPPPPKLPTLPPPLGPQVTLKVLRATGILSHRNLALRVGCDTPCKLSLSGTITEAHPRKHHRAVSVTLSPATLSLGAAQTQVLRPAISTGEARRLRRALGHRRALVATLEVEAVAAAGEPTSLTRSLPARG